MVLCGEVCCVQVCKACAGAWLSCSCPHRPTHLFTQLEAFHFPLNGLARIHQWCLVFDVSSRDPVSAGVLVMSAGVRVRKGVHAHMAERGEGMLVWAVFMGCQHRRSSCGDGYACMWGGEWGWWWGEEGEERCCCQVRRRAAVTLAACGSSEVAPGAAGKLESCPRAANSHE